MTATIAALRPTPPAAPRFRLAHCGGDPRIHGQIAENERIARALVRVVLGGDMIEVVSADGGTVFCYADGDDVDGDHTGQLARATWTRE